jgi:Na+:H+ antiporter, NhaA family
MGFSPESVSISLFIAMLAFDDPALVDAAKRGIIAGSLLAGVAGAVMLRAGRPLRDVN